MKFCSSWLFAFVQCTLFSISAFAYGQRPEDATVSLKKGELATNDPMLLFEIFKVEHNKQYTEEEHDARYDAFLQNLLFVTNHNAKSENERTWEAGLNHLSDLTWSEFRRDILMDDQNCDATRRQHQRSGRGDGSRGTNVPLPFSKLSDRFNRHQKGTDLPHPLPPWFDWRDYGVVSPVKDQGKCGSCWTFATTGALESHFALKQFSENAKALGDPVTLLSEQQLIDCARQFDTKGCDGGLPSHAFEYIKYSGGLETEDEYPYVDGGNTTAHPRRPCGTRDGLKSVPAPFGSFNLTFRDEIELQEVVATTGPVSIAFDVQDDFRFYKSGVYSNDTCHKDIHSVNHAVLAVGYGVDHASGRPYWIVKNSWGGKWGDEGYFKIERNKNMCGVADCASFPNLYSETLEEDAESSHRPRQRKQPTTPKPRPTSVSTEFDYGDGDMDDFIEAMEEDVYEEERPQYNLFVQ